MIRGLIAACYIAEGRGADWQTVTAAYADVQGHPSGSCKYNAAFKVLKRLATFRTEHPDGKVVFRNAPTGSTACKIEITEYRSSGESGIPSPYVHQGGTFTVEGTWPVPVLLYFDEIVVPPFYPRDTDTQSGLNASVTERVPDDLPLGQAKVSLRGKYSQFYLPGPTVTIRPPTP
ncbi:hypothetical protein ACWDZ6_16770 [Streptomyces sp. NPDC002926]